MNSLGVIEFKSIPKGYLGTDIILKNVGVRTFEKIITSPNRYVLLLFSKHEDIQHAIEMAIDHFSEDIYDFHLLGNIHDELSTYMIEPSQSRKNISNLAVFQFETIAEGFYFTNEFLHNAEVGLINMDYSDSVYGNPVIIVSGSLSNLKYCIELAGHGELLSNPESRLIHSLSKSMFDNNKGEEK